MISPSPALELLERRLATDPAIVPTLAEARRLEEALRAEAVRFGVWGNDPFPSGLEGDIALARALWGLPPA